MLSAAITNLTHAFPGHNEMLYIMSASLATPAPAPVPSCRAAGRDPRLDAPKSLTPVTGIFVLGFVVGPLLWAPSSEIFGRRTMFVFTYIPYTIFNAAVCGAKSLNVLLVMRFFAGTFGSSTMTNSG
jgi:MFS family permease